ncbi:MAG: hypothetical protein JWN31_1392, partial [Frankiales bacterium]|nr:hypothetical protein [Frankiales bacterium]
PAVSSLGLTHRDQRLADGGNQFSLTPPDQALCASPTVVVEAVNNAIRTFNTDGTASSGVTALNGFFGFGHEDDRTQTPPVASPRQIGDPSCVYDSGTQRFFLTVYDLASDSAGSPTGPSAVDIAVSPAGTAAGTWSVYSFDTTDPTGPGCPCFSDYPHLATDGTALYITSNEFSTLGPEFNGAQVFALPKAQLTAGDSAIPMVHVPTASDGPGRGFTLSPAVSSGAYPPANTMYFLSSDAVFEDSGASSKLYLWTLSGTSSIGSQHPSVTLTPTAVAVPRYAVPPLTQQPAGSTPLRDCLNLTSCSKVLLGSPNKYKEVLESYDSSDTRVMQTAWAGGQVWGALDTAVDVAGSVRPGIAYYAITPGRAAPDVAQTLVLPGGSLSYPSIGVTSSGHGVIAMSLAGAGHHPSAAYALVGSGAAPTSVQISREGQSAYDDFSGYRAYDYNRPRFGDYGAASVVGDRVWIASEYVESPGCSAATFQANGFTCGDQTRTALANWATRVSAVDVP